MKTPEERAAYERRVAEYEQNQARIKAKRMGLPAPAPRNEHEPSFQAAAAFERGDTFFQLDLPHSAVVGEAEIFPGASQVGTIQQATTPQDALGRVEAVGWRLEHASWVFIETGETSRNKFLTTGQRTVINGEVVGIYLFRRTSNVPTN